MSYWLDDTDDDYTTVDPLYPFWIVHGMIGGYVY